MESCGSDYVVIMFCRFTSDTHENYFSILFGALKKQNITFRFLFRRDEKSYHLLKSPETIRDNGAYILSFK